jgi:hypothetical protein
MVGLAPGLGSVSGKSWPIVWSHVAVAFILGNVALARFVGSGSWDGELSPLMT